MNITCDVPFRHKAEIAILSVHDSIDGGDNVKIITKESKKKVSIYYTYLKIAA